MLLLVWLVLVSLGLLLAAVAGIGIHLLASFRGRTLEAYCRLKEQRPRFGQILDRKQDAYVAANYLFIFGASIALISMGTLCAWEQSANVGNREGWLRSLLLVLSVSVLSSATLACLYAWLPKLIIQHSASIFLYHTWWFWNGWVFVMKPFGALESLFSALGNRLSDRHVDERQEEESLEDEIRKMVMVGERDGLVTRSMRDMISGVMNLDEGQVSQIMTPRSKIDAIDLEWPLSKIFETIASSGRTRLPAYQGTLDRIVGVLLVKDLLSVLQIPAPPSEASIRSILRDVWMIPGTRQIDELLRDFLIKRNHMAIVVDEFQQIIGVVTIEDALEEIVGEIADELDVDEEEPKCHEDSDGSYSMAGTLEVAVARRITGMDLPESDEYETVAGMIVSKLGSIPKAGTKLTIGPYQATVLQSTPRQVLKIRIALLLA